MPIKIISSNEVSQDFYKPRTLGSSVTEKVQSFINIVKTKGDAGLHQINDELVNAGFDKASPATFEIPQEVLKASAEKMQKENPELFEAISHSYKLALTFAQKQRECFYDFETELEEGLFTGQKIIPVERAGLYVPAGRFPLFSSLVMCAAPAKASGCNEIILCTPPALNPVDKTQPYADEGIMATAYICGIDKVFALGGAQAVAAMAYGTESIPRADVIAGPGNKFVTEAKRCVYGDVGIDIIAGPTEAFIIADESANPSWVAADMLAQAEHDVDAQAVLVTFTESFAKQVSEQIEEQLKTLPTSKTARESIDNNGLIIIANDIETACKIANGKAPEHLEVAMDEGANRDKVLSLAHNYGTLFIGHDSAEVLGDYAGGLDHILPTTGAAKFTGGLSVRMFLKTVTTLRTERTSDNKLKAGVKHSIKTASILGHTEGLTAHARAAEIRE